MTAGSIRITGKPELTAKLVLGFLSVRFVAASPLPSVIQMLRCARFYWIAAVWLGFLDPFRGHDGRRIVSRRLLNPYVERTYTGWNRPSFLGALTPYLSLQNLLYLRRLCMIRALQLA
jgi:hypothetical protein